MFVYGKFALGILWCKWYAIKNVWGSRKATIISGAENREIENSEREINHKETQIYTYVHHVDVWLSCHDSMHVCT